MSSTSSSAPRRQRRIPGGAGERVSVRMSTEVRAELAARAARAGMSLPRFLIERGLAGRAGDRTPAAVFAELDLIRVRLARTVGLLEQIAAAAAATGTPPPAMPAVLAELQQTLAQVRTAVRGLA